MSGPAGLVPTAPVSDASWRQLFEHSPLGVVVHDETGRVIHANASFAHLLGYSVDEVSTLAVGDIIHPGDRDERDRMAGKLFAGEVAQAVADRRLLDRHGRSIRVRAFKSVITVDGQPLVMVCITDVRDWHHRLDELGYAASHDELTGLLNRSGLISAIDALPPARRPARLAVLDLNGLKVVNDAHGHAAGDQMLRSTADLLTQRSAPTWLIGRLGGDEFAVVDTDTGRPLAPMIESALATTVTVAPGVSFPMSASVGEVPWHPDDQFATVLRLADREMYRHKRSGRFPAPVAGLPRQTRRAQRGWDGPQSPVEHERPQRRA